MNEKHEFYAIITDSPNYFGYYWVTIYYGATIKAAKQGSWFKEREIAFGRN
jgi:hypothetical protein